MSFKVGYLCKSGCAGLVSGTTCGTMSLDEATGQLGSFQQAQPLLSVLLLC